MKLTENFKSFAVSVITEYEIYNGSNEDQDYFWNEFFSRVVSLPFNSEVNQITIKLERELRRNNIKIDIPDLMIAGTAIFNRMKIATLNEKHFELISGLELIKRKH